MKINSNIWKGPTINILAIETSQPVLSLGLLAQNQIEVIHLSDIAQQSRLILVHIDTLLKNARLNLKDLDAIAVSIGPGRFTGLRLGVSVAQGLALPFDLPIIPISSLQILAQGAWRLQGLHHSDIDKKERVLPLAHSAHARPCAWTGAPLQRHPVIKSQYENCQLNNLFVDIDAMMGERFVGHYQLNEGLMMPLMPDQIVKTVRPIVGATYLRLDHPEPHAEDVLTIARQKYDRGEMIAVEELEPVYLRDESAWSKTAS